MRRDPEDEYEVEDDPDIPDEYLDCSEDHDDCSNETMDAGGWPSF